MAHRLSLTWWCSTFIAGFPGKPEQEFEHLLDFVREAQIEHAGCFAWSSQGCAGEQLAWYAATLRFVKSGVPGSWKLPKRYRLPSCESDWVRQMQVIVDSAPGLGRKAAWGVLMQMRPRLMEWFAYSSRKNQQNLESW